MKYIAAFLVVLVAAPAHADEGDRWDRITILEQSGGGILGGAVGGLAGLGIGAGIGGANDDPWGGVAAAALGGVIGASLGTAVGVKLVGDLRDQNGSWGATIGGAVVGGFLTLMTLPQYGDKLPTWASVALATTTMLAPTIIAYQLSADDAPTNERRVMFPLTLRF